MSLPFNPRKEIFRWGPIPGKFFFCSVFTKMNCGRFRQKYSGQNWSRTLFLFKNKKMLWLNELDALRLSVKKVFLKYMIPPGSRKRIYNSWKTAVKKMENWNKMLFSIDLKKLTNIDLADIWHAYHDDYFKFWLDGTIPELGNYGADKYFEQELGRYIKNKLELAKAIEILTAPLRPSFYQEEEIALAAENKLEKHQRKYFWLKNSYDGVSVAPVSFFAQRKKEISKNIKKEVLARIRQVRKSKIICQKQNRLPAKIINIAEAISCGIAWQDERKKYIFKILHFQNLMLQEVARRFGYGDDLYNAWCHEVEDVLRGKNLHNILEKRRNGFGVDFYLSYKMLDSQQSGRYWDFYSTEKVKDYNEVKGLVVSRGEVEKISGCVRILLEPNKIEQFKKGDILVAPMTSPEYIFAMKKAKAIVTDAGGLTSHAAIVSRELKIPCIVGTKVATSIFKNGDKIEVDTKNGIIKKI